MGQTTYAGLITSDLAGADQTRSIVTTLDEQFSSSPSSNIQKIDKLFETQNNKVIDLSNKQHIITIDAILQSSIDGTNYYIAESDDLTAYTDQMILLLSFDRDNTGNVIININSIGNLPVFKLNETGQEVNLVNNNIKSKIKYFVQYINGINQKLILLNAVDVYTKLEADNLLAKKADLVENKVPKEQLPEFTAAEVSIATIAGLEAGTVQGALEELQTAKLIANRIYSGVDLTLKFTSEIALYSNVWDWIQSRIRNANFTGINVGDYIPFIAVGNTIKAEIAGIDTYYNYGDVKVGHHIDFISQNCWSEPHAFNRANYNNGTIVSSHPWLASDLYAWLNSLSMQVPNTATANPTMLSVNYTTTGVYGKLPAALKAVIVNKRALLPARYTAGALLTDDNSWAWADAGKLWIPSEVEVYGCEHWGSHNGYSSGGFQQYPLFATNMKRVKGAGNGGDRCAWWLLSADSGNPISFAAVYNVGSALHLAASYTGVRAPLCFRIS